MLQEIVLDHDSRARLAAFLSNYPQPELIDEFTWHRLITGDCVVLELWALELIVDYYGYSTIMAVLGLKEPRYAHS